MVIGHYGHTVSAYIYRSIFKKHIYLGRYLAYYRRRRLKISLYFTHFAKQSPRANSHKIRYTGVVSRMLNGVDSDGGAKFRHSPLRYDAFVIVSSTSLHTVHAVWCRTHTPNQCPDTEKPSRHISSLITQHTTRSHLTSQLGLSVGDNANCPPDMRTDYTQTGSESDHVTD